MDKITAYQLLLKELIDRRTADGHWIGRLSTSALSTATAISTFSLAVSEDVLPEKQERFTEMISNAVGWLFQHQNEDGGWGDTDRSFSNSSTAFLVKSALTLARPLIQSAFPDSISEEEWNVRLKDLDRYLDDQKGIEGIRERYGKDKTFVVPILANAALAGLVPWKEVAPLPFELAVLPHTFFRFLRLPVVSYAIPALVAIGQLRFYKLPPRCGILKGIRKKAIIPTLDKLRSMQPVSGGYLEAAPLASFVGMSLIAAGQKDHPVVRGILRFLENSVLEDGSFPIDTNLAFWTTSLAVNALGPDEEEKGILLDRRLHQWILNCQHRTQHPFTAAAPGGWAWTDLTGGVPDADDTSGAILALAKIVQNLESEEDRIPLLHAMEKGIEWLRRIQNRDGGFPTFCRGWGTLPFDRSSVDITAHALRAMIAAHLLLKENKSDLIDSRSFRSGLKYLLRSQKERGYWLPLWFGNQFEREDENPYYGTAKVLRALYEVQSFDPFFSQNGEIPEAIQRARKWCLSVQNKDGGWGRGARNSEGTFTSSLEETALLLGALRYDPNAADPELSAALSAGYSRLVKMIEERKYEKASPIGFYFAKLWYYEDLYPILFALDALRA
ncbi:MAG: prenyltransferase/squalene oxidase repeat-containing protein [Planctomycetia bacterium]|nr:prenyltransferase/squalene oxidase repeat-containing protein [Planctomycetia bacterium]